VLDGVQGGITTFFGLLEGVLLAGFATLLSGPAAGQQQPPAAGQQQPSPAAQPPPAASATAADDPEDVPASPHPPLWVRPKDIRPPPLHIDYISYGLGISADFLIDAGAMCRGVPDPPPCILGGGGGLILRGGYRSPGPWYIGGAYQFSKTDSSNIYRLGILQQLRAEMRYMIDMGYRIAPYAMWGIGGMVYGNEWGVETGGASLLGSLGAEWQLTRLANIGMALVYQPMVFAGWVDTAQIERDLGLAQYLRVELQLELRSELRRN